jgi:carbon monoxide dehydrogenase subunit G
MASKHVEIIQALDKTSVRALSSRHNEVDKHWTTGDGRPIAQQEIRMPVLHERVETRLPIDAAFAFLSDFSNAAIWDPGTATAKRLDAGPVRVGSRFALGVRMAGSVRPMTYRIVRLEPDRQVVLEGSGSGVAATDTMSFERTDVGTRVDYHADIRLLGWRRLLEPVAGGAFARIAGAARAGLQRSLDERARALDAR